MKVVELFDIFIVSSVATLFVEWKRYVQRRRSLLWWRHRTSIWTLTRIVKCDGGQQFWGEVWNDSVNDIEGRRQLVHSVQSGGRLQHRGACRSTNVWTTGRFGSSLAKLQHSSTLQLRNCICVLCLFEQLTYSLWLLFNTFVYYTVRCRCIQVKL